MTSKKEKERWAIENVHVDRPGFRCRVMQLTGEGAESAAKLITARTNELFNKSKRPYRSEYFQL